MDGSPLHREVLAPSIEVLSRIQVWGFAVVTLTAENCLLA